MDMDAFSVPLVDIVSLLNLDPLVSLSAVSFCFLSFLRSSLRVVVVVVGGGDL